ncbi:DUF742 domain-containing protein [Saccharopolyspora hordei]|uniref:DUF742 domain-containing protein n=1 Tax=Saccharopolyspora hordei TaxID=1838 RepID=A0A853AIN2_9PSEU|nr:DUF742 domain-containing protein [Saccharopolyspora hordei]NYI82949.1 hypothetical protein [Saccharopolyspora hordei]
MSTGPEPSGRHHGADHESPEADAFAEVINRFTLDSGRHRRRRAHERAERHAPPQPPAPEPPWPRDAEDAPDAAEPPEKPSTANYIRPYAWTGGRTRSNHRLELETLVSTSENCHPSRLQRIEHHAIAEICSQPRSVAEVGALLGVPLGVAKVLLGDMADLGLVTVHQTVSESGTTSHFMLMERVLSGLRRL